jgi:transcriptional regulator with XRE-family HTH domain
VSSCFLGGTGLNETLCRALLQARLTEEDVATRLQVDPKTVRRWLEGRVPYLRHRWALATLLGLDETDLWPQLRAARSRPGEVEAIYPHMDAVPGDVWLRLFNSAEREIGILADTMQVIDAYPRVLTVLAEKATSGVRTRICLLDPDYPAVARYPGNQDEIASAEVSVSLAAFARLREKRQAEIRLHRAIAYAAVYHADDQILVSQQAYGVPAVEAPVLHLRGPEDDDMVAAYLSSFAHVWDGARSLD